MSFRLNIFYICSFLHCYNYLFKNRRIIHSELIFYLLCNIWWFIFAKVYLHEYECLLHESRRQIFSQNNLDSNDKICIIFLRLLHNLSTFMFFKKSNSVLYTSCKIWYFLSNWSSMYYKHIEMREKASISNIKFLRHCKKN